MKRAFQALILLVVLATVVQAEAIRQPPSLVAGDQYRLAFITSATTTAESADIETYNAFVQSVADAAPIGDWGLTWKAIGSTETVSARENTSTDTDDTSVPIFLLDVLELVPNYSALWNAAVEILFRPFDVNEQGIAFISPDPPILSVWTGTGADGLPRILPGVTGGPLGAGGRATTGYADSESASWFDSTVSPNVLESPMYAISETLTAVPEPDGSQHFLLLFTAFLQVRKSRRK